MTAFENVPLWGDPAPAPQPMSADRKRTAARHADIVNGRHPLTKLPLADNGHTCGDCAHLLTTHRGYFKCDTYVTNGPGTDIRKSWPACTGWKPTSYPCCVHRGHTDDCANSHRQPCANPDCPGDAPVKDP